MALQRASTVVALGFVLLLPGCEAVRQLSLGLDSFQTARRADPRIYTPVILPLERNGEVQFATYLEGIAIYEEGGMQRGFPIDRLVTQVDLAFFREPGAVQLRPDGGRVAFTYLIDLGDALETIVTVWRPGRRAPMMQMSDNIVASLAERSCDLSAQFDALVRNEITVTGGTIDPTLPVDITYELFGDIADGDWSVFLAGWSTSGEVVVDLRTFVFAEARQNGRSLLPGDNTLLGDAAGGSAEVRIWLSVAPGVPSSTAECFFDRPPLQDPASPMFEVTRSDPGQGFDTLTAMEAPVQNALRPDRRLGLPGTSNTLLAGPQRIP